MQGKDFNYAGLISRSVSAFIDGLIFLGLLKLLTIFVAEGSIFYLLGLMVVNGLYVAIFISSRWQATVGQKILGLRVLSADGSQLTFKQASFRALFFFMLSPLILPLLMYFFNAKHQTLYDYLSKSVVIDGLVTDTTAENTVAEPKRKLRMFRTIFVSLISFVWFGFAAYIIFYFSVMYAMYSSQNSGYNNSFHQTYTTNDYNDSRIQFYDDELHQYSKEFIIADGLYAIFEADVKRDLALGCIEYFIRRYDDDVWINAGGSFRKNARNSYANTEEKIEKAKANESSMGHNFYTYDSNVVNDIEDEITQLWSDTNESACERSVPVDTLYDTFIAAYIPKFIEQNIESPYSEPSQKEQAWYKELQLHLPKIFKGIKEQEAIKTRQQEEYVRNIKEATKKKDSRLFREAVDDGKDPLLAAVWFYQDQVVEMFTSTHANLNLKDKYGRTALFIAVQRENIYALELLLKNGADMYVMDENELYTAFTGLLVHPKVNTKMVKLFLENGYNLNFQSKGSETALSVVAKGCENIDLVKLFLEQGADPTLMDRYQSNTILKVQRGCKSTREYKQLLDLLE